MCISSKIDEDVVRREFAANDYNLEGDLGRSFPPNFGQNRDKKSRDRLEQYDAV
jgi:hypothetical protein